MKPIIYEIIHLSSSKRYIGSTAYHQSRWAAHLCYLRNNRHQNSYLQRAWNKYGENAFAFRILQEVDNVADLILLEQQWLDKFSREELFNARLKAHTCKGIKHSEESKRNFREGQKRRKFSEKEIDRLRTMNIGRKHSEETKRKMSLKHKGISPSSKNIELIRKRMLELPKEERKRRALKRAQYWILESPEGEVFYTKDIAEFSERMGLQRSKLGAVARGERKHHKQWKARYANFDERNLFETSSQQANCSLRRDA